MRPPGECRVLIATQDRDSRRPRRNPCRLSPSKATLAPWRPAAAYQRLRLLIYGIESTRWRTTQIPPNTARKCEADYSIDVVVNMAGRCREKSMHNCCMHLVESVQIDWDWHSVMARGVAQASAPPHPPRRTAPIRRSLRAAQYAPGPLRPGRSAPGTARLPASCPAPCLWPGTRRGFR